MKNWKKVVLSGTVIFAGIVGFNLFSIPFAIAQEEGVIQKTEQIAHSSSQGEADMEEKVEKEYKIETMTVTAEKREENIQDIPTSVTALSEIQIEDAGIISIKDLSLQIPNLTIVNWGFRGNSFVFVRGIGATLNEPAVGFYVDDVNYLDSRIFDTNLFDIERIEVLRGPQGTLYGRNSLGGVINIITKKPDNEFHVMVAPTLGNYNKKEIDWALRTPVIENKLFFGLSGIYDERDGYSNNDYLDKDVDYRKDFNGRAKLRWLPGDTLDISLSVDGERNRDGVFPLATLEEVRSRPHHVSYDFEGKNDRDVFGSSLRAVYDAPGFQLTSITACRNWEDEVSNDQDFTPLDIFNAYENIDEDQLTQEIRFASPKGLVDLKWLVGAYYFKENSEQNLLIDFLDGAVAAGYVPMAGGSRTLSDLESEGYAFFGQATYTLFDKLDLTGGLRYDHEDKDMDYSSHFEVGGLVVPGTRNSSIASDDYEAWLPKLGLSYHWTSDFMTYAGVAKGYRSGGFNRDYIDSADASFDSEFSWNYEIGLKSSWFDNRFILNTAAFYIDLTDQQVTQLLPMGANTIIRNSGKSHSAGFEVETIVRPLNGLDLEAGFGYANSRFDDYKDPVAGTDFEDNRTPFVPKYTYNIAAQYRSALLNSFGFFGRKDAMDFFGRVELQGIGQFYWDDANSIEQKPYELVNLRLGLETEHFDLILWAKNLLDTEYEAIAFKFPGFPTLAQSGDPRTIGITLTGRF